MLRKKIVPTTTVSRVRFRSTMCVPPCEAGHVAHSGHPRVASGVHEHERDQDDRRHEVEEDDCRKAEVRDGEQR